ncbi:monocarboxylate transporter 9-like [Ornithodoros turicata]|uniref:monocarboxylate transporter 9-like n=1 Tax=Ornithodoros turicata TaxID=34597 RepID=UPI003138C570
MSRSKGRSQGTPTLASPSAAVGEGECTALPTPPDGSWGWVVVFSSFMTHVVADGVTYTFGIFYMEFLKYFHESKGKTAWVASIMVGTTFCIGPVASGLTSKYGCRTVTIAGSLLATLGLLLSVPAPNVTYLFFSVGICTGAGFGLMYLPAIVSVTMYFEKKRAFATGIAVCGSGFGTFALAPFIEYLVRIYGWQGALLITAGMVLNCCVFGALLRPLPPPKVHRPKSSQSSFPTKEINGNALVATDNFGYARHGLSSCSASRDLSMSTGTIPAAVTGHSDEPYDLYQGYQNGFVQEGRRRPQSAYLSPAQVPLLRVDDEKTSMSCAHLPVTSPPMSPSSVPFGSSGTSSSHGRSLLMRKDIFYSGSMQNLPEYRASPSGLSRDVSMSVTSLRTVKSVTVPTGEEKSCLRRCLCSDEMEAAVREMMNFALLRSPVFVLFAVSNFFTSVGFNVPYVYTKDRAVEALHMTDETASLLLSCIGFSNTVGRVLLGYLSDKPCINRLWLYNANLTICGLATAFSYLAEDTTSMSIYCVIFGATSGAFVSLTSVILVDILGLDKLTNAFGLLLLFEGFASYVGPPVTGWLYDYTGSYDPGFLLSGAVIALGGVLLFVIPCAKSLEESLVAPASPIASAITTATKSTKSSTTTATVCDGEAQREEEEEEPNGHTVPFRPTDHIA